jgi:hypothetical protein
MSAARRFVMVAAAFAFLAPAASRAAQNGSWDGVWTGSLEHVRSLSLTVAHNKVVAYAIAGTPVAIQYSKATPTTLAFGDHDHFGVVLTRTGGATALAQAHGRNGDASGVFTKQ